eukprot:5219969-Pleurochrysis_carterae.AAC.1
MTHRSLRALPGTSRLTDARAEARRDRGRCRRQRHRGRGSPAGAAISPAAVRSGLLAGDELFRAAHLAVGADVYVRNATLFGRAGEASRGARGAWRWRASNRKTK